MFQLLRLIQNFESADKLHSDALTLSFFSFTNFIPLKFRYEQSNKWKPQCRRLAIHGQLMKNVNAIANLEITETHGGGNKMKQNQPFHNNLDQPN